jgi:uncharacterized cupin superfamily protein
MSKKIETAKVQPSVGTLYPTPYDQPCRAREKAKLGDLAGLTQFGVNLVRLKPGVWSSQRHWHTNEDEFVYVLEGEVVLVTDAGEETLRAGDAAGFKAGVPDGHHFQNRSAADVVMLEVGARDPACAAHYPDIDLIAPAHAAPAIYTHTDGTPYTDIKRRGPED